MSSQAAHGRVAARHGLLLATVVALIGALFMGLAAEAEAKKKPKGAEAERDDPQHLPRRRPRAERSRRRRQRRPSTPAARSPTRSTPQTSRSRPGAGRGDPDKEARPRRPPGGRAVAERPPRQRRIGHRQPERDRRSSTTSSQLLLAELNKTGQQLRGRSWSQQEFDFEFPRQRRRHPAPGSRGADHNGRLTMRDVILRTGRREGRRSRTPTAGTFATLLRVVASAAATEST